MSLTKDIQICFFVNVELALKEKDCVQKKINCLKMLKKHSPYFNNSDWKTIKSIKQKLTSNNAIILCKADKGNDITILNKN